MADRDLEQRVAVIELSLNKVFAEMAAARVALLTTDNLDEFGGERAFALRIVEAIELALDPFSPYNLPK